MTALDVRPPHRSARQLAAIERKRLAREQQAARLAVLRRLLADPLSSQIDWLTADPSFAAWLSAWDAGTTEQLRAAGDVLAPPLAWTITCTSRYEESDGGR